MLLSTIAVTQFMTNCFIVGDDTTKDALIIDPGGEGQRILDEVKGMGVNIVGIVNTHAHIDHIGANRHMKEAFGVDIMMHKTELPILHGASKAGMMFGVSIDPPPEPDRFIEEGDTITFGDSSLSVLLTPGHSPGGLSFVTQDGNWCFAGDTLFAGSIGRTDLPGGNYDTLIHSIKTKILPLGDHVKVLPGHGPATTVANERKYNPFL
ncbi:MAG: MBL fold metallo-hydrolase [Deltaproteobacteria bacterium]|nr:MBL fold metallo-hydrolase [Deltaproteobacteria bacterium]